MSVEELKRAVSALSPAEQSELTAFLFDLRHGGESPHGGQALRADEARVAEDADWYRLSADGLARAYGAAEPEYTEADLIQP